jgi:N-acyl-D-amino-acid deacylase
VFDLRILNATILDGTGAEPSTADIGVAGDTLSAIGDLQAAESRDTLDLAVPPPSPPSTLHPPPSTLLLAPGFIDAHSHSDTYLLIEPAAPSKITQGITTEIVGNCGASAAPISEPRFLPSDWADKTYPGVWGTVAEFRRLLETVGPAPNVVLLVGHNTLRRQVVGYDNRPATPDELARMTAMLEQGLAEGARGFSTGLIYPPGYAAGRDELVALARAAARAGGLYTSHMRNEGARVLEAIDEALAIGRDSGARVEISHLKTVNRESWALIDGALDRIRAARAAGQPVAADRYPYTSGATELDIVFPDWAVGGGRAAVLKRLADPAERARLRRALLDARPASAWAGVIIGSTRHPDNARFQGMSLPEAAERLGLDCVDAILRFAETDELRTGAFFSGMSEDNLRRILREPYVMLGSDASLRAPTGPLGADYPHPRAYGSFPRYLRMVMEEKLMALPEAIRKVTSLPAGHFGLKGRGTIAPGAKADLVVFDPAAVRDTADYGHPHRFSEGIVHVVVNGVLTIRDGRFTGQRAGRVL